MNKAIFISKRIFKKDKTAATKMSLRLAYVAVLLSISTAIIAFGVSTGFKYEILNKIKGLSGNLYIRLSSLNKSLEELPINNSDKIINDFLKGHPSVNHFQKFATKSAIIAKHANIQGIIIKGVDENFSLKFFLPLILQGRFIQYKKDNINEIVLPVTLANQLNIKLNDHITAYFTSNQIRVRILKVVGIYSTNITDIDNIYAYGNIKLIQKLNNWNKDQVNGIEIFLNKNESAKQFSDYLTQNLPGNLVSYSDEELFPQIFDWLQLISTNSIILLGLMLIVSIINLISSFFILIIEKAPTIGLFKVFGYRNSTIRRIFIYNIMNYIHKYLLAGNLIGLSLCFIQQRFEVLKLDPYAYFVNHIPIKLNVFTIISVNLVIETASLLTLYMVSRKIIKIAPVNNLSFK